MHIRSAVKVVDVEGCGLRMWTSQTRARKPSAILVDLEETGNLGSPTPNSSRKVVERDDLSWVCQECKALTVLYADQFSGLYLLQAPLRVRVMSPSGQRGGLLTRLSESMAASSSVISSFDASPLHGLHPPGPSCMVLCEVTPGGQGTWEMPT